MKKDILRNTTGAMIRLLHDHKQLGARAMSGFGVHHSQHKMLMYIHRCGKNAPTQVQIAQFFSISAAAVAVTIRKLEEGGYITRTPREMDLRNNEIHITEKGTELAIASDAEFDRCDSVMYRGMSEEDVMQLRRYLDIMQENLNGGK